MESAVWKSQDCTRDKRYNHYGVSGKCSLDTASGGLEKEAVSLEGKNGLDQSKICGTSQASHARQKHANA